MGRVRARVRKPFPTIFASKWFIAGVYTNMFLGKQVSKEMIKMILHDLIFTIKSEQFGISILLPLNDV